MNCDQQQYLMSLMSPHMMAGHPYNKNNPQHIQVQVQDMNQQNYPPQMMYQHTHQITAPNLLHQKDNNNMVYQDSMNSNVNHNMNHAMNPNMQMQIGINPNMMGQMMQLNPQMMNQHHIQSMVHQSPHQTALPNRPPVHKIEPDTKKKFTQNGACNLCAALVIADIILEPLDTHQREQRDIEYNEVKLRHGAFYRKSGDMWKRVCAMFPQCTKIRARGSCCWKHGKLVEMHCELRDLQANSQSQ